MSEPFFSVVVPVRDGGEAFGRCLTALATSRGPRFELLAVDDGSSDGSAQRAAAAGARVLTVQRGGPAAARNLGARAARGEWLLFLDADCEVASDTLAHAAAAIAAEPAVAALFGAYDDAPAAPGLLSQYRNLLHCHTHHASRRDASTFWSGCGTVRRDAFFAVGGFDERRFPRPGMEDVDLGYRLRDAGHRIRLDPAVQVKHLKAWTLRNLVRTDLFERGIPWTELWLARRRVPADLNLAWRHRINALCAVALAASPLAAAAPAAAGAVALAASAGVVVANAGFFRFLVRRRGAAFALAAVPLHVLYGWCCAASFAIGLGRHLGRRRVGAVAAELVPATPAGEPRTAAGTS